MVLTGDAGDEVLSGYPVHQSEKIAGYLKAVPALLRSACIGLPLGALNRHGDVRFKRMSSLYELAQLPLPQRILRKQNALPMEWRGRLLDKGVSVINPAIAYVDRVLQRKPELSTRDQPNYWLFKVSLSEDMFRIARRWPDRSRHTIPDHRIVELLAVMTSSIKIRAGAQERSAPHDCAKLPGESLRAPNRFTALSRREPAR
jgi:asparagine synthase (glutamine-hydrolysing)